MFNIIIAGGRNFNDYELLKEKVDFYLTNITKECIQIISGMASGADTLGYKYAIERGYPCIKFPAKWDIHGKAAGHIRNKAMAEHADALIAFWDGRSRGTKNMIDIAKEKNIMHRIVYY